MVSTECIERLIYLFSSIFDEKSFWNHFQEVQNQNAELFPESWSLFYIQRSLYKLRVPLLGLEFSWETHSSAICSDLRVSTLACGCNNFVCIICWFLFFVFVSYIDFFVSTGDMYFLKWESQCCASVTFSAESENLAEFRIYSTVLGEIQIEF